MLWIAAGIVWRMSKKDGKATLLKAQASKDIFILTIPVGMEDKTREVVKVCPVRVIKLSWTTPLKILFPINFCAAMFSNRRWLSIFKKRLL